MSSSSIALQILTITQQYALYINCIIFITGIIGNTLNILVFTNLKIFRSNCCAFYLIAESIGNLPILLIVFVPQIVQIVYGTDPASISPFFCKFRTAIGQSCRLIINSIICFEALDQYLSTHHQFFVRQMSTIKLARYLVFAASILWLLQSIPGFIFFDIVPPLGCIITNQHYKNYQTIVFHILLNGFIPILFSSLFSILAYQNVRRIVRRQVPIERRRLDRQLTAMIFVRVIFFITLSSPFVIYRVYSTNVIILPTDILPYAINQLVSALLQSSILWIYALNFYIFLATSSRYRRQMKYFLLKKCWQSMKRWCSSSRNAVQPVEEVLFASGMELDLLR